MRVLVVEDDASVAAALTSVLTRAGHTCTRVATGAGLLAEHTNHEVVLLDLGLEDMDGLSALGQLRERSDLPVIVVTARGDERSTVVALRLGADDYLIKPVRMHELLARIEAVSRRAGVRDEPRVLEAGRVRLDLAARRATCDGAAIALTPTEFSLLSTLVSRAGEALSRPQLVEAVWGAEYPSTSRAIDVHLAQLRQKLPEGTITTIRGFGYRFEPGP
ncbi:response regulator transcription factor [Gulosibacter faecalis]|jgi:DNA-binding response OmpR family regulator|uniref:Sensory transduction protein RegX3 n=1 Tax=Gulosibacter faecalis TaxID=272240 RepID=A0ABW5UZ14_9MICO|nr:response regulator transcription factor [Gulosibacter faecalis]